MGLNFVLFYESGASRREKRDGIDSAQICHLLGLQNVELTVNIVCVLTLLPFPFNILVCPFIPQTTIRVENCLVGCLDQRWWSCGYCAK